MLADTPFDLPAVGRGLDDLRNADLVPFVDGIAAGAEAVMMAHVTYSNIDTLAAGYSNVWIQDVLRGEMGYGGLVIGDDIGMAAAESIGNIAARIEAHLKAGCDLVLACSPSIVDEAVTASRLYQFSWLLLKQSASRSLPDWPNTVRKHATNESTAAFRGLAEGESHS